MGVMAGNTGSRFIQRQRLMIFYLAGISGGIALGGTFFFIYFRPGPEPHQLERPPERALVARARRDFPVQDRIFGQVVRDSDGSPVSGAWVSIAEHGGHENLPGSPIQTGGDGRFEFRDLERGAYLLGAGLGELVPVG